MSQHTNTPQNHTMPAGPAANEMAADADGESACIDSPPELDEAAAYQGFGSFHSDNVEDLIAIPEAKYRVPDALPTWARTLSDPLTAHALSLGRPLTYEEARQVLGHRLRASHFGLDPSWTFVNHGAFGGALKAGMQVKRQFEDLMEEQPLAFVDRTLLPLLVYSTRTLAKFLNARPQDVVLVSNATFGLNAAINAILRTPKDKVAFLDVEYGSVWKMMRERCSHLGCTGVEIPLMQRFSDPAFMASDDAITAYIEEQLPEGTTAFVLDHVSSNTALELPIFTHIVPMLKRKGVQHIIVDGAHGPLQYALDFESLPEEQRPSVYVGNLHKWVACPKSVGFVWTRPDFQKRMHSPVVSHGSRAGYLSEFIWDGTKDYGAYLALPAVLHFWTSVVGAENARRYCRELMSAAERLLCAGWGTQPVPRGAAFMKLVELPAFFQGGKFSGKFVQDALHAQYKVELPVKTVNDKLYVRISTFVNNEVADYEVLRDAVNGLISVLRKRARAPDGTSKLEQSHPAQPLPTKAGGANSGCGGCGLPLGHSRTMGFEEDADDN